MQNGVAEAVVMRSLRGRHALYTSEVERLIHAGLSVMRRDQTLSPKVTEIIQESGLSNQAFYRHFRSKDELLVAILEDGARQLVNYLEHVMAKESRGAGRVRRWVEGVLAQAVDPVAADATRPFVVDSLRLVAQFPEEASRSQETLEEPLRQALSDAVASGELPQADPVRDAEAIYHLVMGTMQGFLVRGQVPTDAEVRHLVRFVLAGLAGQPADVPEPSPRRDRPTVGARKGGGAGGA